MVLETLRRGAPTNISSLAIEDPQRMGGSELFDPNRDISEAERLIIEDFITQSGELDVFHIGDMCSQYLELFPELEAKFQITPNLLIPFPSGRDPYWKTLTEIFPVRQIKSAFPNLTSEEIFSGYQTDDVDTVVEQALNQLQTALPQRGKYPAIFDFLNLKMLFPEKFNSITFAPGVLKDTQNMLDNRRRGRLWIELAELAANSRLLFEDQIELGITQADWKNFRKVLESLRRQGSWEDFINLAADLAIVAADEVTVDETGVHKIFYPKPGFEAPSQPLPKSRKF